MVITLQEALEKKLKKELAMPSEYFSRSFLEDICSVFAVNEWNDDVILRFIKTPNLLREVAWALHNDDALSEVFEQRTVQLTLELIARQEGN